MLEVHKHAAAERDLIAIWRYTFEHWGAAQADAYLDEIEAALDRLRRFPKSGVDCGVLRTGYRRIKVGMHHLYYRVRGDRIDVIRVLDGRQDADRHLE